MVLKSNFIYFKISNDYIFSAASLLSHIFIDELYFIRDMQWKDNIIYIFMAYLFVFNVLQAFFFSFCFVFTFFRFCFKSVFSYFHQFT